MPTTRSGHNATRVRRGRDHRTVNGDGPCRLSLLGSAHARPEEAALSVTGNAHRSLALSPHRTRSSAVGE
jgi:hypothetical protein